MLGLNIRSTTTALIDDLRLFWGSLGRYQKYWLWGLLLGSPVLISLFYFDAELLEIYRSRRPAGLGAFAQHVSDKGDFPYLAWFSPLLLYTLLRFGMRADAAQAARRLFLVAILAGVSVNVFRFGVGRPRPMANLADGLYGPSLDYRFHGTPSGHSTLVGSYAGMATVVYPPAALVFVPLAVLVGWSRVELRRHHFGDVALGLLYGAFFGVLMGLGHRDELREQPTDDLQQTNVC